MTEKHLLQVSPRTVLGKKVKQLRSQGLVVGSISTPEGTAKSVQFDERQFTQLMDTAGESALIYVQVAEEKQQRPVLIEEVQLHPLNEKFVHVSFRQVSLKEKVTADVPVEIEGTVDIADTTLVVVKDMIKVEALPTDLPEKFVIDVTVLTEAGQTISYADLVYDKAKVTLIVPEDQDMTAMPVVMLQEVKEEVAEEPAPDSDAEGAAGEAAPAAAVTDGEAEKTSENA